MVKITLATVTLALMAAPVYSQTGALAVANPSFEADNVTAFPTYRATITGWEKVGVSGFGVNTNGPFYDNGAVPDGSKVLFLQQVVGVRQMVPGFVLGQKYILQFRANARESTTTPLLRASVGDVEIVPPTPIPAVGGTNPFHLIRKAFVSTVDGTSTVTIESVTGGVDNTLLIDHVEIFPAPEETFRGASTATQLFKLDADSTGSLPWFLRDHMTRGMCYNPHTGHLLVVDREAGNVGGIHILDAATGTQLGSFNTTGMSGGTFVVNKVAVDGTGRIFVSNLAVANSNFRVYSYASEAAAQTSAPAIAFAQDATPTRWGDDLDVKGSGAATTLLVASRGPDRVLVLTDPDNDGTFAGSELTPTTGGVSGPGNVALDPDSSSFWFHRSMTNFVLPHFDFPVNPVKLDGDSAGGPFFPNVLAYPTGSVAVRQTAHGKLLAVGPAEADRTGAALDVRGFLYDLTDATGPVFETGGLERAGGFIDNGNGAGDVAIDPVGNRVFFLATNNSISGWRLPSPPSAAQDWMLFD